MGSEIEDNALTNQLAWQTGKHLLRQFTGTQNAATESLKEGSSELKAWFASEFSTAQKLRIIEARHTHRANRLAKCDWELKRYPIDDLGTVLPEMGDLPPEVLTGPLTAVAKYVADQTEKSECSSYSVAYIAELAEFLEIVEQFPPLVIEPGNLQRTQKTMSQHYGPRGWDVDPMAGYIEDGNHRALATVLGGGRDELECYVASV